MATKSPVKKKKVSIQDAYMTHVLLHGKKPESVFAFCHELGIGEEAFYQEFTSFNHIEEKIWKNLVQSTVDLIHNDATYASFSAREKALAFYFTFFQEAIKMRSFIIYSTPKNPKEWMKGKSPVHTSNKIFKDFANPLIIEGMENGEIANRQFINKYYDEMMWFQFQFLLTFWIDDTSNGFENTDAAIEKATNMWFDLIERGAIESISDFAKFLVNQKFG
ncbi:MAG: hypothetical protein JJU02_05415 [Cryomorphaceae bacterium]|nr:hypothetical protein [Cryomorphaceae bacterium]